MRRPITFLFVAFLLACGGGSSSGGGGSGDGSRVLTQEECEIQLALPGMSNADLGVKPELRATYNVHAESIVRLAAASAKLRDDTLTACQTIAKDLEAELPDQAAAEGRTNVNERTRAWCALAQENVRAVATSHNFVVAAEEAACVASAEAKSACMSRCAPADASCETDCARVATSAARCEIPIVSVETEGTGKELLRLENALESSLGQLLVAVRGRGQAYTDEVFAAASSVASRFPELGNGVGCKEVLAEIGNRAVEDTKTAIEAAALVTSASGL